MVWLDKNKQECCCNLVADFFKLLPPGKWLVERLSSGAWQMWQKFYGKI